MANLHPALHLQHHHHTGRLLHHRHTSYRGLLLVLFAAGCFMVGLNMIARATADSLFIYAQVPALAPANPATITDPAEGAVTHTANLQVQGNCPPHSSTLIISILDNDQLAGSVACDSSNAFAVQVQLAPGTHTLVARNNTITGNQGPDSNPVHITYTPPVTPPVSTGPTTDTSNDGGPAITSDQNFVTYGPGQDAVWSGNVTGGTGSYDITVDWGDGTTTTYHVTSGVQTFTHHYSKVRHYTIHLKVTDSQGNATTQSIAAVSPYISPAVIPKAEAGLGGLLHKAIQNLGGTSMVALYSAYIAVAVVFIVRWLHRPFVYAKVPAVRHKPHSRPVVAGRHGKRDRR